MIIMFQFSLSADCVSRTRLTLTPSARGPSSPASPPVPAPAPPPVPAPARLQFLLLFFHSDSSRDVKEVGRLLITALFILMKEVDLMGPTTGNVRNVVNTHLIAAADFILIVNGDTVLRETPHAHPVSPDDTEKAHFISSVKYNTSSSSAGDIVREALLGASADVQSVIPTMENLKQLNRRQKIRSQGYNVPTPRSAASIVIPFEYQNDGHLLNPRQFLYRDCYTPNGKRVIAFISVACLESRFYKDIMLSRRLR